MKKKILVVVSIIILVSVCFFNVLFAVVPNPDPTEDDGGIGGGSEETWYRYNYTCEDKIHSYTDCDSGGTQQCTATYCP